MNPKADRTTYLALLERIKAGEITRAQASELAHEKTGLAKSTFISWLTASRVIKEIKHTRMSAGQNSHFASKDPDKVNAYEQAVSAVLNGMPGKQVAKKFGVSYPYLMRQVARARPPKKPSLPPKEDLIQAIMIASGAHLKP